MTTRNDSPGWNKIITFCSVFGIPLISVCVWLIVNGTKAVDSLNSLTVKVTEVQSTVKDVQSDLRSVHVQIDSIRHAQQINKLDQDWQFKMQQQVEKNKKH